jgi:lipid-binding SYLF domain-containing protein
MTRTEVKARIAFGVVAAIALAGCATTPPASSPAQEEAAKPPSAQIEKKRAERRKLRDDTLAQLYEIAQAEGYAVFDGTQLNLVLYVGASGQGILVDKNGVETFMQMKRAGMGPGVGYKDYRQIIVFKSRALLDQFRTVGADVSASADATVKMDGKGSALDGSVSFNPQLSVYQITDRGLLLQANWGGVAYIPDADLN